MKLFISTKGLAAAALAVAGFGAASAAHARSDLYFSIGLQGAPVYVEPAPVYMQPRPVYVQPPVYEQPRPAYTQPVYAQPVYTQPTYTQPQVFVAPAAGYDERRGPPVYGYSYEEEQAWRRAEWRRRYWKHHHYEAEQYQYQAPGRY